MDLRPIADIEFDSLDDLVSDVVLDCPGVNEALALRRLQEAHYQFCKETQVWRAMADPIQLVEDVRAYDISHPDEVVIDRLYFLEGEGNVIPPVANQFVKSSDVRGYVQAARDNITLLYDPNGPADPDNLIPEDFLWPRVVLLPPANTDVIDCRINQDWGFRSTGGTSPRAASSSWRGA